MYLYDLNSLVGHLQTLKEDDFQIWVYNFLYMGYTSPLIGVSSEPERNSVIEQLYLVSDSVGKIKLRNSLKEVYYMTPLDKFNELGFIELLRCITLLNITGILPDLYKIALKSTLKNVKSDFIPSYIDMHTILLKTIFGLSNELEELDELEKIAKRDITDKKYMLECFHYLMVTPKFYNRCIDYIPELLLLINNNERDYKGIILKYLMIFGNGEIINRIVLIAKKLENRNELIKKFVDILLINNMNFIEMEDGLSLFLKEDEVKISEKYFKSIEPLLIEQENIKTHIELINAKNNIGGKTLVAEFKESNIFS